MFARIAAGLVLAVVAVACNGNGDPGADDGPDRDAVAIDASEFAQVGAQALDTRVKVTYEVTAGGEGETQIQRMTLSQDPPRRSIRYEVGGETSLLIEPGDGAVIVCGGGSGQPCVRFADETGFAGAGAAFMTPLFQSMEAYRELEELPGYVSRGRTTIAGRSALCASWNPPFAQGTTYEQCLDAETGIGLSWRYEVPGEGLLGFEAVEFGEPSDADFEPTGEVQELPTGPGP